MFLIAECFAVFMNCLLFSGGLGLSTIHTCIRNKQNVVILGCVLTVFCSVGSVLTFQVQRLLNLSNHVLFIPLIFLSVDAVLYLGMLILVGLLERRFSFFPKGLSVYLHEVAFSCAVLGTFLINAEETQTVANSLTFGIRCGLGFLVASGMIAVVAPKLNAPPTPAAVRGWPALLIYIGILSMGFTCFKNVF